MHPTGIRYDGCAEEDDPDLAPQDDSLLPIVGSGRRAPELKQHSLTPRALLVGLIIGIPVSLSNLYFGLQIGFSSQMSMQSSLLGFAAFKMLSKKLRLPLSPQENVVIQTVAGAVGCMPVTAGLIGVIPALEFLLSPSEHGPISFSYAHLLFWSLALCLFGLVWAMILRRQLIVQEKLPWPGSMATATLISVLHTNKKMSNPVGGHRPALDAGNTSGSCSAHTSVTHTSPTNKTSKIRALLFGAVGSGCFTFVSYFVPILHNFPLFGTFLYRQWLWSINVSFGFIGSGIITGPAVSLHMLAGAFVGWAVLSPIAKTRGWAPGHVDDWEKGSRGWIMWISLASLLADCLIKLGWLFIGPLTRSMRLRRFFQSLHQWSRSDRGDYKYSRLSPNPVEESEQEESPERIRRRHSESINRRGNSGSRLREPHQDVERRSGPRNFRHLYALLFLSGLMCIMSVRYIFDKLIGVPITIAAFTISLPLSIMGIRAVGETDWNPMSGIGKLGQLAFAFIVPIGSSYGVLINLIAGGLAEAGASQAGDIGHDLKIGYLLGARPEDQFYGQVIGSVFGSVVACIFYRLYTAIYTIPSELFQIPVSHLFILAARLVNGAGLPEHVFEFALAFGVFFAAATVLKIRYAGRWWQNLIPGGVAFGVGMYNAPSFTLARGIGGILYWYYVSRLRRDRELLIVSAGGLVLGEGLISMLNLGLAAAKVPQLT